MLSTKQVFDYSNDNYYREGELHAREGVITAIAVGYGQPNKFGTQRDVILQVTVNRGQFEVPVTIEGNYRRDDSGRITGWGGLFRIALLLESCGITTEVGDDGRIPREALEQLVGKKVVSLSVPYEGKEGGGYKYFTYPTILGFLDEEGNEREFVDVAKDLIARFYADQYAYNRYLQVVGVKEKDPKKEEGWETITINEADSEEIPF